MAQPIGCARLCQISTQPMAVQIGCADWPCRLAVDGCAVRSQRFLHSQWVCKIGRAWLCRAVNCPCKISAHPLAVPLRLCCRCRLSWVRGIANWLRAGGIGVAQRGDGAGEIAKVCAMASDNRDWRGETRAIFLQMFRLFLIKFHRPS
jgi:hypothetical protein